MESAQPPSEADRRVLCGACDRAFDAAGAAPGDDTGCPHCGETVRVGPAVRRARRVRRSEARREAEAAGVRDAHLESDERRFETQDVGRATRCPGCRSTLALVDTDADAVVTCPKCGVELRIGERQRERRRVLRTSEVYTSTSASDDRIRPLVRVLSCAACGQVFDSRGHRDGEELPCPGCGARCSMPAPQSAAVAPEPRGGRAFWMGLLVGVGIASVISAIVAVSVVAWVLAQRRG